MANDYYSNLTANSFFPLRAKTIYDPSNFGADLPQYDPVARMSELYKPQDEITKMYIDALKNMPQREPAGKLRTIAAALAGLGAGAGSSHYVGGAAVGFSGDPKKALETADLVKNKPYYEKMSDWQNKEKALAGGAAIEERGNTNQRLLANETVGRELQEKGQANTLRHQMETENLAKQKSDQIYDTKLQDMQRKMDDAQAKLDFAQSESQRKQGNTEAELRLRQAQIDATNARHKLDIAQKQKTLDEQKTLHENMKKKWEDEDANTKQKLKDYEEKLKTDKNKPANNPNKDVTTTTKDKDGKVIQTKETRTRTNDQKEEERATVYDLKTGKNLATIPKSNVAKLDKTKYGVR